MTREVGTVVDDLVSALARAYLMMQKEAPC
jgi:hypothetical protein